MSHLQGSAQTLESLVSRRLGLRLNPLESGRLKRFVDERLKQTQLSQSDYLTRLQEDHSSNTGEWQSLAQHLTNNESFFFRDNGLFALLQSKLLPDLIQQNQHTQTLRIWSAGCSRGEEIYSIAMLLIDLLNGAVGWQLQLIGTDLNEQVLAQARKGLYSDWSLRGVGDTWKQRYFSRQGNQWQLDPRIRERVTFSGLNLKADNYPEQVKLVAEMDLIICRNVFIYFAPDAVQETVSRFERCLKLGGMLVPGHSELRPNVSPGLSIQILPGSSIFKRTPPHTATPLAVTVPPPVSRKQAGPTATRTTRLSSPRIATQTPPQTPGGFTEQPKPISASRVSFPDSSTHTPPPAAMHSLLELATKSFHSGKYEQTIALLDTIKTDDKQLLVDALKIRAECWSNLGKYDQALSVVETAIKEAPFAAELFYLFAHIAELKGDKTGAIRALEKSLYLDDQFIPAYIDLSALLDVEGRSVRVRRLRITALNMLNTRPADSEVAPYQGITVGDLRSYLHELVGSGNGAIAVPQEA